MKSNFNHLITSYLQPFDKLLICDFIEVYKEAVLCSLGMKCQNKLIILFANGYGADLSEVLSNDNIYTILKSFKYGIPMVLRVPSSVCSFLIDPKMKTRRLLLRKGNNIAFFKYNKKDYVFKAMVGENGGNSLYPEIETLKALNNIQQEAVVFPNILFNDIENMWVIQDRIEFGGGIDVISKKKIFASQILPVWYKIFPVSFEINKISKNQKYFDDKDSCCVQIKSMIYGENITSNVFIDISGRPVLIDFENVRYGNIMHDIRRLLPDCEIEVNQLLQNLAANREHMLVDLPTLLQNIDISNG